MGRVSKLFDVVRLSCLGAFLVGAVAAGGQQIQVSGANRTIAVAASEDAERRADTAVVHVGYQLYAATSPQVIETAASISKAITDVLRRSACRRMRLKARIKAPGPCRSSTAS